MARNSSWSRRAAWTLAFAVSACSATSACVVGCGSSSSSPSSGANSLAASTGTGWILEYQPVYQTVTFAFPRSAPVALGAGAPKDAVIAFLDENKATFGMVDPTTEWTYLSATTDSLGTQHLRYQQMYKSTIVYSGTWVASVTSDGKLASMSGTYVPVGTPSLTAATTMSQATASASADAARRFATNPGAIAAKPEQSIAFLYPNATDGTVALAYEVDVTSPTSTGEDMSHVVVDANTGAILDRIDARPTGIVVVPPYQVLGQGYGSHHYAPYNESGGMVYFPLSPEHGDNKYYLSGQNLSGVGIWTSTLTSGNGIGGQAIEGGPSSQFVDTVRPQGGDLDAQSTMALVVDAYKSAFGRLSYDDNGGQVEALVGSNSAGNTNAFFQGDTGFFAGLAMMMAGSSCIGHFGIGDGDATHYPAGVSFDILAHEFTHAVSACSWGGSYSGNSGAVNEAMSDVMAMLLVHATTGQSPTTYGHGTTVGNPTAYSRDPGNPHDPNQFSHLQHCATLDEFTSNQCGSYMSSSGPITREPHLGSTIVSYAFELMTNGGTHITTGVKVPCGLGWDTATKVWSQVEFHELKSSPDFKDVATATLSAARKQKISLIPIACAWQAVNVITADEAKNDWKVDCSTLSGMVSDGGASSGTTGGTTMGGSLINSGGALVCSGPLSLN